MGTLQLFAGTLWPAFAAAAALGLVVAFTTCSGSPTRAGGWGLVLLAVAGLGAGAAASLLAWVPGRPGLWLEIALLVSAVYVLGCFAGCLVRKALGRVLARAQGASPGLS